MNFSNTTGTNVTAEDLHARLAEMRAAIESVDEAPKPEMRLHPSDVAELKRRYGVSRLSAPMIATIRIIEDAEMLPLPRVR